nr:unnamed protein product [Naegleria fowleri]
MLISLGAENELKIWDLVPASGQSSPSVGKGELKFSKNVDETNDIALAPNDDNGFITVGKGFVRFWSYARTAKSSLISVRSVLCNLDVWKQANFVSIESRGKNEHSEVYAITEDGILCKIDPKCKELQSWVNTKVQKAFSMSVSDKYIATASAKGVVRLFETKTLQFKKTLPEPPPSTSHITMKSVNNINNSYVKPAVSEDFIPPSALACGIFGEKVAVMYDDRSLFVWDISNLSLISKYRSFISHSGCVWDLDVLPVNTKSSLPPGTFATCSSDNTIRFWNIDSDQEENIRSSVAGKSAFCKELLAVLHIPPSVKNADGGIRSISFSPDGSAIISGDKQGHVRVHDVFNFDPIYTEFAHESEVLCLDSHQLPNGDIIFGSGSRDRMIHLYKMSHRNVDVVQTLDDHSSSVTSLKFSSTTTKDGEVLKLVSIGAEKSVVFRRVEDVASKKSVRVVRYQQTPSPFSVFDLDVDITGKWAVTAGQGKRINVYDIESGKCKQYIETKDNKPVKTGVDNADPLKVKLCPAGIIAVTSASDKHLRVYSFYRRMLISRVKGHADVITSISFTHDLKRLITTSADGCIFIWSIGTNLTKQMMERMDELEKLKRASSMMNSPVPSAHHMQPSQQPQPPTPKSSDHDIKNVPIAFSQLPPPPSARGLPSSELVKSLSKQLFDLDQKDTSEPHEENEQHSNKATPSSQPILRDTLLPQWAKGASASPKPTDKKDDEDKPLSKWAERVVEKDNFKLIANVEDVDRSLISNKRVPTPSDGNDDDLVNSDEMLHQDQGALLDKHKNLIEDLSDGEDSNDEDNIIMFPSSENSSDTSFQVAENDHTDFVQDQPSEEKNEISLLADNLSMIPNNGESIQVGDLEAVSDSDDESDDESEVSRMISKKMEDDLAKPVTIPSILRSSITSSFKMNKQEEDNNQNSRAVNNLLQNPPVDESAERFSIDTICKKLRDAHEDSQIEIIVEEKPAVNTKAEIDRKLNEFKEFLSKHEPYTATHLETEVVTESVMKTTDASKNNQPEVQKQVEIPQSRSTVTSQDTSSSPKDCKTKTECAGIVEVPVFPMVAHASPQLGNKIDDSTIENSPSLMKKELSFDITETHSQLMDQSDMVQIQTPREKPEPSKVTKIKNNIAKLTCAFEETIKEMEELSYNNSDGAMEAINSFQKMVAQMNVRMSQSARLSSSHSHFVFSTPQNLYASSGTQLSLPLNESNSSPTTTAPPQVDVSDMLERYSSVLIDYIMKKVDNQMK